MRRLINLLLIIFLLFSINNCSTESTPVYQLTTTVEPSEAGSVTPANAEAEEGDSIQITADSNEHWVFDRWSGDYSGNDNPASILMDVDKSVTAIFVKQDYPLTINKEGEGSVSQQVIQPKTTEYPHGTLVELTAEPDEGWEFNEWSGNANGDENPINITVEGETTVTANFERIMYPLTIEIEGQGTVEQQVVQSKITEYHEGTVVELEAIADQNWLFSEWTGDINSEDNPVMITIDEPKTVTATFLRTYTLTTTAEPVEGGVVIPQDTVVIRDTDIEVEAIANDGWRFVNWQGDYSGSDNPLSATIDSDLDITGVFEQEFYEVNVTAVGRGSVSYQPVKDKYVYGDEIQLQATPNTDHEFIRWQGGLSSSNRNETFTVTGDHEISAVFRGVIEMVKQRWGSRATINNILLSAGLSLENGLPEQITVTNFRLLNQNGTLVGQSSETHNVGPGSSLTYSISFNTNVTTDTFSNYTGDWRFTYKGKNYRKTARVGSFGTASKIVSDGSENTIIDLETFKP